MESKVQTAVEEVLSGEAVLQKARVVGLEATRTLNVGSDVEVATRIAGTLRAHFNGNVVHSDGEFYAYTGKCWEAQEDNALRKLVHKWDGAPVKGGDPFKLSSGRITGILREVAVILFEKDWFSKRTIGVNCENGFVEITRGGDAVLMPHDPLLKQRHVIGGEWLGSQPLGGSLLSRLLTGCFLGAPDAMENAALMGEVAGVSATGCATKLRVPKAVILTGPLAQNGKSQMISLFRSVLPENAVCTVPPTKFGSDEYVVRVAGKLLNTSDELGGQSAISGEMFKRMVTGEPVEGRDLYDPVMFFRPIAQHVFACNALPSIQGGMDRGVIRRLLVVPFKRRIPDKEQMEDIADHIRENEMSLVISWLIAGAQRVMQRRTFLEPISSRVALEEWARQADPVLGWVRDRLIAEPGGRLKSRDAYTDFRVYAQTFGYTFPVAVNQFSQKVESAGVAYMHSGDFRGFTDVRLKGQDWSTLADLN